ncbi:hypothetical protein GCM10020220_075090 [Nonomuraea rubra]|uniref:hypothetical protein n=1 Tax=Nonomuraea rubra TaxID=46180 RepID=UPI0031EB16C6
MSTKSWLRSTLIVTALTASILPSPGQPGANRRAGPEIHDFQAENSGKQDVDNRQGRVQPPANLRLAAPAGKIRWNALGTPAAIVSAERWPRASAATRSRPPAPTSRPTRPSSG